MIKKALLIAFTSCFSIVAMAQMASKSFVNVTREKSYRAHAAPVSPKKFNIYQLAKTTAVPFETETFGTGTTTTLPAGWTAGGSTASSWKWRKTACVSQYNIGVINSTTAANGWMVYDSDSIGAGTTATQIEGWLQSPSYNCAGHPTVQLAFQQHFKRFNDSCFIMVSNNGGVNWTKYNVNPNNTISSNSYTPSNPHMARVNISATAANQPNVLIRFHYVCIVQGGAYNWLVDDVELSELDPVEVGIENSGILSWTGNSWTSFSTIPKQLADTIWPVTFLTNYGATSQSNINVNAKIFSGASQVYNQDIVVPALPVGIYDSLVDFSDLTGYHLSATGNYTLALAIAQAGDAFPANDKDSVNFSVSDSVYSRNVGIIGGSYFVHRPSSSPDGEESSSIGTLFEIDDDKSDTLTSVSVSFGSSTTAGSKVLVQIYKFDGTSWSPIGTTFQKTLSAADISTTANVVFSNFVMDFGSSQSFQILGNGTFAAVVVGNGVLPNSTVTVYASETPVEAISGIAGVADDANNNGAFEFGTAGLPGGLSATPLVRLNFGNGAIKLGVNDLSNQVVGTAYPNPSHTEVKIPFSLKESANVTVSVSNTLGQVLMIQNMGKVKANNNTEATFNTTSLSNGIYFITLEANGQRTTKRFVVAH